MLDRRLTDEVEETLEYEYLMGKTIYPVWEDIYRAFDFCELEDVKICILGQDPYHGPDQANGLAFSVDDGIPFPPSLKNIFTEMCSDLNCSYPTSGDLASWAEQGVLLLNSALTVEEGNPGAHVKLWEPVVVAIITALIERKVIFLLWGNKAWELYSKAVPNENVPLSFMRAAHPSPFSVNKGFFGCKHFSKANEWLKSKNKSPIEWRSVCLA